MPKKDIELESLIVESSNYADSDESIDGCVLEYLSPYDLETLEVLKIFIERKWGVTVPVRVLLNKSINLLLDFMDNKKDFEDFVIMRCVI